MFRCLIFPGILINLLIIVVTSQDIEINYNEDYFDNNLPDSLGTSDILDPFGEGIENIPKDLLLSWQARRSIRKFLAQMPCGWPERNIPPLAPFISENHNFSIKNSLVSSETYLTPIRIDGLNDMEINRLTIGIVLRRANFDFNFPNITFSGNFNSTTKVDLKQLLGLDFTVNGSCILNLSLENLRIMGSLRYKLPIFYGIPKIYKLQAQLSLGNVRSQLSGVINGIPISEAHNELISTNILKLVNNYKIVWNDLLEQHLMTLINSELEGKILWNMFTLSRSLNEDNCNSENLKGIDMEELHQLLLRKGKKANVA